MTAEVKRETVSPVDAAWLHMEAPNNLMMITGVFTFDEPMDFDRLKATLEQRFAPFDRFWQRVAEPRFGLGSSHWEPDPSFDLSAHVHRIALPSPGDQDTLQDLVSDLMSMPLDFSKPLWQFHLVENYGRGCALICRLHHSIGDGIALMRVLLSITDDVRDGTWTPSQPEEEREQGGWNPFRVITGPATAAVSTTRRVAGTLLSEYIEVISHPSHALDLARLGSETAMALGRLVLRPPDPRTIFKGPLGVPKRAAWTQTMALADVKRVCRASGTTVNDVLLSAVTGALRRYLQDRDQPVDGLNFRAVVPVNLRQNEEHITLGNRFGLVFLSLPIGIDDPLERLEEVKHRMDDLKASQEAVVAFGILNAIGMAPNEIENIVVNIFGLKATAVMTNVVGPQQQLYLAGASIDQIMFWVPQSGRLGLGISIMSYNQEMLVGFVTDAGLVPDPEVLAAYCNQEIQILLDLEEAGVVLPPGEKAGPTGTPAVPGAGQDEDRPAWSPPLRPEPAPAAATSVSSGDDLTQIKGIGQAFSQRLRVGGIASYADLASSSADQLAELVQAPAWRRPDYQGWIEAAQALSDGR